jgi:hypothetical protein
MGKSPIDVARQPDLLEPIARFCSVGGCLSEPTFLRTRSRGGVHRRSLGTTFPNVVAPVPAPQECGRNELNQANDCCTQVSMIHRFAERLSILYDDPNQAE